MVLQQNVSMLTAAFICILEISVFCCVQALNIFSHLDTRAES